MKKLSFLLGMLFLAAGMSFAQNTATVDQSGGNANDAYTVQTSNATNTIFVKQVVANSTGYNLAGWSAADRILQNGNGNFAGIVQTVSSVSFANQHNEAKIIQDGNSNRLVDATTSAVIYGTNSNAIQASRFYSNDLDVYQTGYDNQAGLHQDSYGSNVASIDQFYGTNRLGAFQYSTGGNSWLNVSQNGGDIATVIQTSAGNNNANINQ